jgi:hypothetical protein
MNFLSILPISFFSILLAINPPVSAQTYYKDGVDARDGMSAKLNLENEPYLRVAGEVYGLELCSDSINKPCFRSDYAAFAATPSEGKHWRSFDLDFEIVGVCYINNIGDVQRIESKQKLGTFEFFYDKKNHQILGWILRYCEINGRSAEYVYSLKGVNLHCSSMN